MTYSPNSERYSLMNYEPCGASGLKLPKLALGLWHNFGFVDTYNTSREIILKAFDKGITHFDLANNYGPPAGSAETNFGNILNSDLKQYRDELIIATKAGYGMWEGPYGDGGSKKYLIASIHQSLQRMKLDYVDIFYHHRFDPETPLEETADALELIYKQGKALYIGLSNYNTEQTISMLSILTKRNVPCLIHQFKFSMFHQEPESSKLIETLHNNGIGSIAFSPLAQGLLTDRYLQGIPENSRAAKPHGFLQTQDITPHTQNILLQLHKYAQQRNQTLAELALSWIWKKGVTSVLIGASSTSQLETNLKALNSQELTKNNIEEIDAILQS